MQHRVFSKVTEIYKNQEYNIMNKMASLLTFSDAKQQILSHIQPLVMTEDITLIEALHRIVAQPVISPINVPSFNNSAMDGYAVRIADLAQSTTLPVAGKILAGDSQFPEWPKGTCLRIMTGAPVPSDADAVVMQEETEQTPQGMHFTTQVKPKQNIRYAGEDVQQHAEVIRAGQALTIPMLSTLATLGISHVRVFRPIRVALFSTGDELTSIGTPLTDGKIYDSNRFTLHLMLKQLGCEIIDLGIIGDNPIQLRKTFQQAEQQADLIITSGGVSVGDADYTKQVLDELGQIQFWKIAMKPGKPFAYGKINNTLFCGLPGNPVSAVVTFYQLVQPLILKMSALTEVKCLPHFKVKTLTNLKKTAGRVDFQRGQLITNEQGELVVTSTGQQGSHITQSLGLANCFIILEKDRGNVSAGEWVTVELFNTLMS